MSITVPSNRTRIGAWVNSKMSGSTRTGAWVNSNMSGRNPLVYCTIALIAMQGYHT